MFIYVVETVLVLSLITHVVLAIQLTRQNKAARGQSYAVSGKREKGASLASQTMAIHGVIILIFFVHHLLTFKYGPHYETTVNGVVMRDLFRLIIEIFKQPIYVGWYVISLFLLGFHLSHGVSSLFQSFGLLHPSYQPVIRLAGKAYAVIVVLGFIAQPVYILFFT
jgi:succinate dehydrogenase / fumarate reductase cytochrome b subunit